MLNADSSTLKSESDDQSKKAAPIRPREVAFRRILSTPPVDGAQALSDLTEISSQIQAAIVLDADGSTLATTLDEQRGPEFAEAVQELLSAVQRASGDDEGKLAQAEIATGDGSVFLVRDEQRTIAATTGPEPTVGLVFYDLKSCLRGFAEPKPKPKPRARKPKAEDEGDAAA
jgi:predicted regulator of Ras-like GTPase activity (Roadblock/LC7/MglB family)